MQVNAVSTALLGVLLVSWMKDLRPSRAAPARLTFVTSGTHLDADTTGWPGFAAEEATDGGVGGST